MAQASSAETETETERATSIAASFQDWTTDNALSGAIAVLKDGKVFRQVGVGMDDTQPVETASLSKAITAICVSELVRMGKLSYDSSAATLLDRGPDVSVAHLLTHTAGLGPDMTQISMQFWFGSAAPRKHLVRDAVALRPWFLRGWAQVGTYQYSNETYALLGMVVEAVSGRSYEATCRDLVLTPSGARGKASPKTGAFLPWGGWLMTLADYGRFHAHWFGRSNTHAQDPHKTPMAKIGSDFYYGLGTILKADITGTHYWHTGALCFPGRLHIGTFAATWANGWTVVTTYDSCIDDQPLRDLQRVLVDRAYGVGE